jgi:hypothetical protein
MTEIDNAENAVFAEGRGEEKKNRIGDRIKRSRPQSNAN